jgi:CBS domain-containing protein
MQSVGQYLQTKGHQVWATRPDATVYEALALMAEKDIGSLLVMEGDRLVGIFSERDYARKVILHGKTSRDTRVSEIMTSRVAYISPEHSIDDCMALMTELRVRHLPVLSGERVVGVISIGDVVKSIISEQKFVIQQLEKYITSSR